MKRRIILLFLTGLFITACGAGTGEVSQVPEAVTGEPAEEGVILPEKQVFIGEIYDCLDEDGYVNVYAEKDERSDIIHVYDRVVEVELLETLPFGWFKIRMQDGREGYVDARNIRTEEFPPHGYDQYRDGYVLIFTHDDQILRIYRDGNFILSSIASSGLPEHFTPRGVFEIEQNRRGEWFYVERYDSGMKYWVGFKGIWLFHSVPFDRQKRVKEEEAAKLGRPASQGCIRLPVEIAAYIHNNVPDGSLVLIY
ncbi:MAG: L,D-transpeptidase family protein [Spirochaetales bacterium]|nr:L,D-transpeptidase family protein [Spirochaetales bacterium]